MFGVNFMSRIKTLLFYYGIITIVFFSGKMYISNMYNMKEGPVPREGFEQLFDWVHIFSYLYIVPLLFLGLFIFIRFFRKRGLSFLLSTILSILYILFAAMVGYVLLFAFVLVFYGFAP
jgi:hypothetical protein